MYKKLLHGLDGSGGSFKALREAVSLAKLYNAELHTLTVERLRTHAETMDEMDEEKAGLDRKYEKTIHKARALAKAEGVEIVPHYVFGHEVKEFLDLIEAAKFDLLVIGFRGHSKVYDWIRGGTSQSLTRLAPCTVLVVK